jgi:hypothetical protein
MTNKLTNVFFCAVKGLALCAAILFAACDAGFIQKQNPFAGPDSDGNITVTIAIRNSSEAVQNSARSVLPQFSTEDIHHYELKGGKSGESETVLLPSFTAASETTVILTAGTWNFTVNAYNDEGAVFLQGKLPGKIISATTDTLDFYLLPLSSGQGSIRITVNFPNGAGITAAVVTTDGGEPEPVVVSGTTAVYEKSPVNAGYYFVSMALKDSNGTVRTVVSELVLVQGNITSEKTITLETGDFKPVVVPGIVIPEGGAVIVVSTQEELEAIRADLTNPAKNYGKNAYILANDITLTGTWAPIGSVTTIDSYGNPTGGIVPFSGNFYGQGHTIQGLILPGGAIHKIGLFGYTDGAEIHDLTVEVMPNSITLSTGAKHIGVIVGHGADTIIANCGVYSTGTLTVSASNYVTTVGGIAGSLDTTNSKVINSYAALNIDVSNTGTHIGLAGIMSGGQGVIENCYFIGSLKGTCGYVYLGGLSYENNNSCSNSYVAGALFNNNSSGSSYTFTGGVVGKEGNGSSITSTVSMVKTITHNTHNSYYGRVYPNTGVPAADLQNNYAYSGMLVNGATVTDAASSPGNTPDGLGKTAAQLKQRSTYETGLGWDFNDVWEMGPSTYPFPILKWQNGVVHLPAGFEVISDPGDGLPPEYADGWLPDIVDETVTNTYHLGMIAYRGKVYEWDSVHKQLAVWDEITEQRSYISAGDKFQNNYLTYFCSAGDYLILLSNYTSCTQIGVFNTVTQQFESSRTAPASAGSYRTALIQVENYAYWSGYGGKTLYRYDLSTETMTTYTPFTENYNEGAWYDPVTKMLYWEGGDSSGSNVYKVIEWDTVNLIKTREIEFSTHGNWRNVKVVGDILYLTQTDQSLVQTYNLSTGIQGASFNKNAQDGLAEIKEIYSNYYFGLHPITGGSMKILDLDGGSVLETLPYTGSLVKGTYDPGFGCYSPLTHILYYPVYGSLSLARFKVPEEYTAPYETTDGSYTVGNPTELTTALTTIKNTAGANFTITVNANLSVDPAVLTDAGFNGKTITIKSGSTKREISLANNGSLFSVGSSDGDVTLILENITLKGKTANNAPLVKVNKGNTLILNSGSAVTENNYANVPINTGGGGIYCDGGTVEINGGEISGNTISSGGRSLNGGGIFATNNSVIIMNSGSIKNNTITASGTSDANAVGGGIHMDTGSYFELNGGIIEGNNISATGGAGIGVWGAGIFCTQFKMTGGIIRNNHGSGSGQNEWCSVNGGGVFASGDFVMEGGIISGNTVTSVAYHIIYGSYSAGAYGSGLFVAENTTFTKTGGIIYGSEAVGVDADGYDLKNVAIGGGSINGGQGHAVFLNTGTKYVRNTTAGEGVNMTSSDTSSTGGWE